MVSSQSTCGHFDHGWLTHPPTCGAFIEHEYFWLSFVVYVVIFVAVVVAIELWKRK